MTITSKHERNPAVAWNIEVVATGAGDELIRSVKVELSGSPLFNDSIRPPANIWKKEFLQKGVYPGLNKLLVTAQDQGGKTSTYVEEWGS